MRHRLTRLVAAQPTELILGAVNARIDKGLSEAHRAGLKAAKEAMGTERYFRLLDAMDALLQTPQWSDLAMKRADTVLPGLVEKGAPLPQESRAPSP